MSEYTKYERDAINKGWRHLEHVAEQDDHSAPIMLAESLKYERRGRDSITTARGVLLQCFVEGYNKPDAPISSLAGISQGCARVKAYGAGLCHTAVTYSRTTLKAEDAGPIATGASTFKRSIGRQVREQADEISRDLAELRNA